MMECEKLKNVFKYANGILLLSIFLSVSVSPALVGIFVGIKIFLINIFKNINMLYFKSIPLSTRN